MIEQHHGLARHEDIMFPVVERPVFWKDRHGEMHETDKKMLLRWGADKEAVPLAVVNNSYKLVHNKDVMAVVEETTRGWVTEVETYTDQMGAKSYIDVMFKDVTSRPGGRPINFRTIFWNGYGGSSFGAHIGAINFFCLNGMILGSKETTYRRHTKGLDPEVAHTWIVEGLKTFEVHHKSWGRWLNKPVTNEEARYFIAKMTEHEIQQVKLQSLYHDKYVPQYGENLFSVHQVLTDFATHYETYKLRAVNSNSKNERSFTLLAKAEKIIHQFAA